MKSFKRNTQTGFTLIELVVVIVILGILAATALPKFADMGADARLAKINAARGAVMTAASTAHAQWVVKGSTGTSATLDGTSITLLNGYPDTIAAGIVAAAGGLTDYSITPTTLASNTTMTIASDSDHTGCSFTYSAAAAGVAPVIGASPALSSC